MERAQIWSALIALIALSVLVAVIAASQMVVNWHQHELKIGSYLDCLMKYDLAKRQGKVPSDPKPPSGSEVCGHLK